MLNPQQFYGKGISSYFPADAGPVKPVPLPGMSRSKKYGDYDKEVVRRALKNPPRPVEIDPRTLRATQRSVTSPGVRHYASGEWEATGALYADQDNPGNRYPVVYTRFNSGGTETENLLLSGHHRATAALLQGRPLRAIHIEGPYGQPR